MTLAEIILTASHVPIAITTCYAIIIYKDLKKELRIFSWFVFGSCAIQFAALVLALNRINNLPLLHVYVAAGFVCLVWFYTSVMQQFIKPLIIWVVTACFVIYTSINSLFFQSIFTFNSMALTVESILIIILSLSTFIFLLNDVVKEEKKRPIKSINWINSGLFIYYSSSLLIFYVAGNFPSSINQYTWVIHSLFSVIMYSCFFIGFWKRNRHLAS